MCNLYSLTKTREELVNLFAITRDTMGEMSGIAEIYPDTLAPVVRMDEQGGRELSVMRWGFPPPPKTGSRPVTNVRNVASPFWRNWLKSEFRCLVPATAFCEWSGSRPKTQHWFEMAAGDAPMFAFAGIWRPWRGVRRGAEGEHRLFSFLTCESNDIVRPVHAKAMPVVLADEPAWDQWLTGSTEEALELQQPCPAQSLMIKPA
ncbi:MAG TPA: SOS response-associated peptidase [Aestuariivirgaceae bacterium]|nr:SOS response-associated peptidase [Aestuariivirgaceae bacterium]